jgi:hypothetical protein
MRGFRGSIWADTFMAFVVQVKVIMNVINNLGSVLLHTISDNEMTINKLGFYI